MVRTEGKGTNKGLTGLAKATGVSVSQLSRVFSVPGSVQHRKPSVGLLGKIAEYYSMSADQLMKDLGLAS